MSNLIREYLDELTRSLALTPPIRPSALKTLYDRKDYPAMLGWIKNSMNLNLRVGLRIVDRPETFPPMWIETPEPMPAFGTAEFNETRVIVNARRDILETKPFPWVVAGFAHELSHVVLFSVGHRLQHDEKAVDLTAMILGYQRYISDAEVTKTKGALLSASLMLLLLPLGIMFWRGTRKETTRLGYLTSTEALAACQYLAKIGYAPKTKVETGHRSSETGIAAFIIISGAAAIFSIAMLSVFFRGSADSSVHTDRTTAVAPLQGANKLNPPPVDIMAAQNRLIKLRFLAGPADGVWGTKSRMALRAFKIANGLAADDKWDDLVSGRLYSTQAVPSPLPLATGR
jgi:hypothetical protein